MAEIVSDATHGNRPESCPGNVGDEEAREAHAEHAGKESGHFAQSDHVPGDEDSPAGVLQKNGLRSLIVFFRDEQLPAVALNERFTAPVPDCESKALAENGGEKGGENGPRQAQTAPVSDEPRKKDDRVAWGGHSGIFRNDGAEDCPIAVATEKMREGEIEMVGHENYVLLLERRWKSISQPSIAHQGGFITCLP